MEGTFKYSGLHVVVIEAGSRFDELYQRHEEMGLTPVLFAWNRPKVTWALTYKDLGRAIKWLADNGYEHKAET